MEYGFQTNSTDCNAKYCLDRSKFKDLNDMFDRANLFGSKLKDSSIHAYRRARCHPDFKEQVTPKV